MGKFDFLIGSQVIDINNYGMTINKNGNIFNIDFKEDGGDCCGYNNFETKLLYSQNSGMNPVITNIQEVDESDFLKNVHYSDGDALHITLLGESKPIAEIDSYSSSGSGWCYGACVKMVCKPLNIEEFLTEW